jgi:hypothetical protein
VMSGSSFPSITTKTTPAPRSIPKQNIASTSGSDVTSGDVSPLTEPATAGADVAPTGRESTESDRTNRPGVSPD